MVYKPTYKAPRLRQLFGARQVLRLPPVRHCAGPTPQETRQGTPGACSGKRQGPRFYGDSMMIGKII